jgi:hypothetical protein
MRVVDFLCQTLHYWPFQQMVADTLGDIAFQQRASYLRDLAQTAGAVVVSTLAAVMAQMVVRLDVKVVVQLALVGDHYFHHRRHYLLALVAEGQAEGQVVHLMMIHLLVMDWKVKERLRLRFPSLNFRK